MAALSITVSAITPGTDAVYGSGVAGVTITAGQAIYLDATTNTIKLADANLSAAASAGVGIAAHAALAGQPLRYYQGGTMNFGAILTAGLWYVVGAVAAGDIAPAADLASGWYSNLLGYATTTAIMKLNIVNTGVVLA